MPRYLRHRLNGSLCIEQRTPRQYFWRKYLQYDYIRSCHPANIYIYVYNVLCIYLMINTSKDCKGGDTLDLRQYKTLTGLTLPQILACPQIFIIFYCCQFCIQKYLSIVLLFVIMSTISVLVVTFYLQMWVNKQGFSLGHFLRH